MAHNIEPMDIDNIESDFDNKENNFHHSNVLPSTEKGYEELDVSELNMKLRYSITPASSPMSKSYTANCLDNRNIETADDSLNALDNVNLTRSFNSMMTRTEINSKSFKIPPLQPHQPDQILDNNRNNSVLRPLDTTIIADANNITVTVTQTNDIDEGLFPSSSSSIVHTPEATTPTKEVPRNDGGSPIMRGLKTVLNMFRSSQSPIPAAESEGQCAKHDISSPAEVASPRNSGIPPVALASTPIAADKNKETVSSKRTSPHKESVVFNEDLEKELLWKDETTILFSQEKIPIHKLFFQNSKPVPFLQNKDTGKSASNQDPNESFNTTIEYMDVSCNDSIIKNKTVTETATDPQNNNVVESDSEFVDCETTFINQSGILDHSNNLDRSIKPLAAKDASIPNLIVNVSEISQAISNLTQDLGPESQPELASTTFITETLDETKTIKTAGGPLTAFTKEDIQAEIQNTEKFDTTVTIAPLQPSELSSTLIMECQDNNISIESSSKPFISSTFIKDNTPENVNRTVTIEQDRKSLISETFVTTSVEPSTSSTFVKDGNQDFLNGTVTIDQGEKVLISETFVKDVQDTTVSIEPSNKPLSSSTFIKDTTQDAINGTVILDHGDKLIMSSTFVKDKQNTEENFNVAVVKECLDKIMTIDASEKIPMSTTFVNDIQNIELPEKSNVTINQILNSAIIKDTEEIVVSPKEFVDHTVIISDEAEKSTMSPIFLVDNNIKDETIKIDQAGSSTEIQEFRNKTKSIEQNDKILIPKTFIYGTEKKEASYNVDFNNASMNLANSMQSEDKSNTESMGISQVNESVIMNNMDMDVNFHTITKESEVKIVKPSTPITKDNEISVEAPIDAKDVIGSQISQSEMDNNEKFTLQNESRESSLLNKDILINRSVNFTEECTNSAEASIERLLSPVEHLKLIAEYPIVGEQNINKQSKIVHTSENQFEPNVSGIVSTVDPDILQCYTSSNVSEVTKVNINAEQIKDNVIEETVEDPAIFELGNLPADIPLPDEDDLEIEAMLNEHIAKQPKDITTVVTVLPDIINVLHVPNTQNPNEIDKLPINTMSQAKSTADLINDTVLDKEAINQEDQRESLRNVEQNMCSCDQSTEVDNIKPNEVNTPIVPQETSSAEITFIDTETNPTKTQEKNCVNQSISIEMYDVTLGNEKTNSVEKFNNVEEVSIKINTIHDKPQNDEPMDINESILEIPGVADAVAEVHKENTAEELQLNETHTQYANQDKINPDLSIRSDNIHANINSPNISLEHMDIDVTMIVNEAEKTNELQQSVTADIDNFQEDKLQEEVIISENDSPYVLVSVDEQADKSLEEEFEKIDNPFVPKSKQSMSPPISPKIVTKGYNFNFDEIEDPFATKTKIRMSPTLDSPKQSFPSEIKKVEPAKKEIVNKNRRKSQPERKKPILPKKSANKTFDAGVCLNETVLNQELRNGNTTEGVANDLNTESVPVSTTEAKCPEVSQENNDLLHEIDKSELEINVDNTSKLDNSIAATQPDVATSLDNKSPKISETPSSSEQSIYYSAGTSSSDSIVTKNVFNLPEIDDINFNPFATKSKMRQSPPISAKCDDTLETKVNPTLDATTTTESDITKTANLKSHEDATQTSKYKLGAEENARNTVCSSKATDEREIHTDDEDTLEGPFLEVEDLDDEKIGEFSSERVDMMQFTNLPAPTNEENELFIDAEAFEFLLNQNKSNVVADSGKESLFLKFDPLFAKRMSSDGVAAALSKIQKRQSTPKKTPKPSQKNVKKVEKPTPGTSTSNVTLEQSTFDEHIDDLNVTTSKPMMVVTPAVNPAAAPRKSTTPVNSNRRSITFTSPAIAVIDRLLSLSANNSLVSQDTTITQVSREQNEADLALTQLRELLAEKEINVYNLRSESKELKDRLTTMENQMKSLEAESEERLKKINELNEKLSEKTKLNKSMAAVVEEYERTIASLIAETEQDKKLHNEERMQLMKERDEQTAHLASMEVSFSDLHSKYEKSKQIILSCKANEDTYKKSIKEFEENLTKMQNNYELLKQHATSKLNHANQELEKMNRAHESEVLKLNAMIKRKELHITSLEETLAQKTKANEELTAICDELINKVG